MNDILGREIKVGDVVCWSSGSYVGVQLAVVIKLNPKTIQTDTGGLCHPSNILIVSEQLGCSGQQEKHDAMVESAKERFDFTAPSRAAASTNKYRYTIRIVGEKGGKPEDVRVYVGKIESSTSHVQRLNAKNWEAKHIPSHYNGRNRYGYTASIHQKNRWSSGYDYSVYYAYQALGDLPLAAVKALNLVDVIDSFITIQEFESRMKKLPINTFDVAKIAPSEVLH